MARQRGLRQNITSAMVGNIVYSASQFGMLSTLAHYTSPVQVGIYAFALALTSPVFALAYLKLRSVQVTDARSEYDFGHYLGLRILMTILAAGGIAVTAVFAGDTSTVMSTILAVTLFKSGEAIVDVLYGAMQRRGQMHLIARSLVLRGIGGFLIFWAGLALTARVDIAAAGLAIFTLPQILTNARRVRLLGVSVRPVFSRTRLPNLALMALPVGASVALGALTLNIPRYFIVASAGTAALGIFASIAYVLVATGTVVNSMAQAASPRLADEYVQGNAESFRRIVRRLLLSSVGLGGMSIVFALLVGERFLRLAFGPEYAERNDVLVVLMCAGTLQYASVFLGASLNAVRKFKQQLYVSVATLVTVLAGAPILIPMYGLTGASVTILLSQLLALAIYSVIYRGTVLAAVLPAASGDPEGDSMDES